MLKFVDTILNCRPSAVVTTALDRMDDRGLAELGVRRADIPRYISRFS